MKVFGFNWDDGNIEKCKKHGVSLKEIESVFENSPLVKTNIKHLSKEVRYQAVGQSKAGRYIFVVFTIRTIKDGSQIRPISARFMHLKEINNYEKQRN